MRGIKGKLKSKFYILLIMVIPFYFLSCSDDTAVIGELYSVNSGTGSYSFSIVWKNIDENSQNRSSTALSDCGDIETVEAYMYDESDNNLASGSWSCSAHQGTLEEITAGTNRKLIVVGMNSEDYVLYYGEIEGIEIIAGQTVSSQSPIEASSFLPPEVTSAPEDGAIISIASVNIEWDEVPNAAGYRIVISESSDLSNPIIDEDVTGTIYSWPTLSDGETNYWTIYSVDFEGNSSIGKVIQSFRFEEGFHGITILDSSDDVGSHSAIGAEDGNIYICYYNQTNKSLKVARSHNDGKDWMFSTINSYADIGLGSAISVDADNVFISTTIGTTPEIGVSKSSDGGDTWSSYPVSQYAPTIPTAYLMNAPYAGYATSVICDGSNIFISYLNSNLNMFVLKSDYNAESWEYLSIQALPGDTENGYYLSMKENNGKVYASHSGYEDSDIYFTSFQGDDFTDPDTILVDQVNVMGDKGYTSTDIQNVGDETYVYIAYFDEATQNLKFAKSINDGANFSLSTIDEEDDITVGKYPSISVSNNVIYVSYYDETNQNIKMAKSVNGGDSWNIITVDDSEDDVGQFSSLVADGQKIYISYYDATNGDLKFAKSIDGGITW